MAIGSIVDYLKGQGRDSSYSARKKLAEENGITNYSGTAEQNTSLLKTLQNKPATVPAGATAPTEPTGPAGVTYATKDKNSSSSAPKYEQSEATKEYLSALKEMEANKPEEFSSQYTGEISAILDGILNKKEFNYGSNDLMNDSLYQMYRDNYMAQGNKAMRDVMGNASALTGGYGSTYAQAAGQQAYDSYLSNLNDIALEFADRAYNRYQDDNADRYNQLSAVQGLDNTDYSRYRDTVGDYYNDLNYLNNRYTYENGFDYDIYLNQVAQQQWQEEYDYQKAQAAQDQANWAAEFALAQQKKNSGGYRGSSGRSYDSEPEDSERISWAQAKTKYDEIYDNEGKQAAEDFMEYLEDSGLVNMYKEANAGDIKPLDLGNNVIERNMNAIDIFTKTALTDEWRKKWLGTK